MSIQNDNVCNSDSSGILWRAGIRETVGQTAAEPACLGQDFISSLFVKSEHELLMFERREAGHVVLVIDENRRCGGPKKLQRSSAGFGIQGTVWGQDRMGSDRMGSDLKIELRILF